jgi:hypothetical protein
LITCSGVTVRRHLTVSVTRCWAGVDYAHYTENAQA